MRWRNYSQALSTSLDQFSKVLYSFLIASQAESHQNMLKLSCRSFAFTSCKTFSRNKKRSKLVFLPHFLLDFGRKIFATEYPID